MTIKVWARVEYEFTILEPKPSSARISVLFPDMEASIKALRQSMEPSYELYIASATFQFGIFITSSGIEIWDAEHESK